MDESRRLVGGAYRGLSVANHGSIVQGGKQHDHRTNGGSSAAILPTVTIEGNGTSSHAEVPATLDDKASLTIVMCVVFLGDTARGIFFPTLWTYVKMMGGDRIALGYCVGAFSLGRVMISPYFGSLSTKHGYRRVLMAASGIIFLGAMAYVIAWNRAALITAQILMGVGSGTLGVTRAYVADKSTPEQRTYLLAYTTAVQYAGFTCMPFLGGLLCFQLKDRSYRILDDLLVLNEFTAPAFVMATAAVILLGLLNFVFKDSLPKPKKKNKAPAAALVASDASAAKYLMGTPSDVSLAVSLSDTGDDEWPPVEFRRHGDASSGPHGLFVDSDDETESRQTPLNSAVMASDVEGGPNGYIAVLDDEDEEEELHERARSPDRGWCSCHLPSVPDMLIYGGFLLNMSTKGTIACFETLGAEYAMTHFDMTSAETGSTFATFGSIGVVSLLSMRIICRFYNDVQIVLGGMAVMIIACMMFVPAPTGAGGLPFFLCAVFLMYSVGYPIGHTAVLGLFSKVVGAQPQGMLLGWFGSAGSLARIVFPVIAGVTSQELGTSKLFMAIVFTLFMTAAILFSFRRPYLECMEITKRRSLSQTAYPTDGTNGNGNGHGNGK